MKKIIAISLMLAAAVAGAKGYKDWFTPQKGWTGQTVPVYIQFGSSGGKDFNFPVTADLGDIIDVLNAGAEDVPQTAKNAYIISISALANSIFAACKAQMNKVKIDNLGAALEGIFVSTYGQYVDEQGNVLSKSKSGVDTSKLRQQLIANKNAVVSGGQAAGGSEKNPLTIVVTQKPYDERQFEQHIESGRSLTSLHGWYSLSDRYTAGLDGSDGWAFDYKEYFIPYSNGKSSTLGWMKWNGHDAGCLSAGDDVPGGINDKPLRLYGWTTADNCNESIQNLLTNETATVDRSRHKILTRYDNGSGATIHWMPFDESVIGGGSEGHADDKSIELTSDEGASESDPKKFRLKGFDTAKPKNPTDGAVLPFVDATSDDLQWGSIMNFFSDSVFRKSETTGKILLNGTSEKGKVKVLAMTGNGGDDQQMAALTFDNASIDGNPAVGGVVQLHGFDIAPSPYESGDVSFADVLTNTTTQITGMSVPVRVPSANGATVAYVPMGKITGTPASTVDNKTIEYTADKGDESDNPTKCLRVKGSQDAAVANVPVMGAEGQLAWKRIGGNNGYGSALVVTNATDIDLEPVEIKNYGVGASRITLRGWDVKGGGETGRGGFLYGCGQGGKVGPFHAADMRGLTIGPHEAGSGNNYRILRIEGIDSNGVGRCSMPYKCGDDATAGLLWTPTANSAGASVSTPKALVSDGNHVYWGQASSFTTFEVTGTDGNTRVMNPGGSTTNRLEFAAASGCNITANAELETDPTTGKEKIKVTIGVYYASESELTPPLVQ